MIVRFDRRAFQVPPPGRRMSATVFPAAASAPRRRWRLAALPSSAAGLLAALMMRRRGTRCSSIFLSYANRVARVSDSGVRRPRPRDNGPLGTVPRYVPVPIGLVSTIEMRLVRRPYRGRPAPEERRMFLAGRSRSAAAPVPAWPTRLSGAARARCRWSGADCPSLGVPAVSERAPSRAAAQAVSRQPRGSLTHGDARQRAKQPSRSRRSRPRTTSILGWCCLRPLLRWERRKASEAV